MWLPIVLGVYWVVVLGILGRILVVCSRNNSGSIETKSETDEKE